MAKILVAGLINIETTLRIDAFPLHYNPVNYPFGGVRSTVSGVGFNIAKALRLLGHEVRFLSLIGSDLAERQIRHSLAETGVSDQYILSTLPETPQSVILFEPSGRRQIHVDLKNIQEQIYPLELYLQAAADCEMVILCNINFTRALLPLARQANKSIVSDVHAIHDLEDAYNRDYMAMTDILFMSDENLPCAPAEWATRVMNRYHPQVVVVGMGAKGLFLLQRDNTDGMHIPVVYTRQVVNTIGAGDALLSGFVHGYIQTRNARQAARLGTVFASYKVGANGAAEGFLGAGGLEHWFQRSFPHPD